MAPVLLTVGPECSESQCDRTHAAAAAARDDSFGAFAPVMVSPVRRMSLPDLYGLSNE